MGVIHKLKPEIKEFILAEKKRDAHVSCRGLSALIESKFKLKVSKSRINHLIKESGLSMPVGRRVKKKGVKSSALAQVLEESKMRALIAAEEEVVKKAVEEAALKVAEEAVKEAEEEAARKQQEDRERRKAEAVRKAREIAKKAEEEAAKLAAEEEFQRQVEQAKKAEEKARAAAEEAARRSEEERARRAAQEEASRRAAQQEALRLEEERRKLEEAKKEEESERKAAEEEERRLQQERARAEAAKQEAEEARRRLEEEERKVKEARAAAEEAAKAAAAEAARKREEARAEEEAARRAAQEEASRRAEEEAKHKAEEEEQRKAAEEEARRWQEAAERERREAQAERQRLAQEDEERKEGALRAERERLAQEAEEKAGAAEEKPAAAAQEAPRMPEAPPAAQEQPSFARAEIFEASGKMILQAVDYLFGGSYYFSGIIKSRLPQYKNRADILIDQILYQPLSPLPNEEQGIPAQEASACLSEMNIVGSVGAEILQALSGLAQGCRGLRVRFGESQESEFYLDAQLRTVWSTQYIPYHFSSPVFALKKILPGYFSGAEPLVLFTAPGYDAPPREFFNFLLHLDSPAKKPVSVVFYGDKFEETDKIALQQDKRCFFIFALWPWQFAELRRVKKTADFRAVPLADKRKNLFMADVEVELAQSSGTQPLKLRGLALKSALDDKNWVMVLTNLPAQVADTMKVAQIYLRSWPEPQESFRDYSHKIELFTYAGGIQRFSLLEALRLKHEDASDIRVLLMKYLEMLDAYCRWYLLPEGYEQKGLAALKERFYGLKAQAVRENNMLRLTFLPDPAYPGLSDLQYLCRRLNERGAQSPEGLRLFFGL